jgi:hypothetical protein
MRNKKKLLVDTSTDSLVLRSEKDMEFQINGDFVEVFERSANSLFRIAVFHKPIMVEYGEN